MLQHVLTCIVERGTGHQRLAGKGHAHDSSGDVDGEAHELRQARDCFLLQLHHLANVHTNTDANRLGFPWLDVNRALEAKGGAHGIGRRRKPREEPIASVLEDLSARCAGDDLPEKGIVPRDQIRVCVCPNAHLEVDRPNEIGEHQHHQARFEKYLQARFEKYLQARFESVVNHHARR